MGMGLGIGLNIGRGGSSASAPPAPGTAVLSGSWADPGSPATRPAWHQTDFPMYSGDPYPNGWTASVEFRIDGDGSLLPWFGGSFAVQYRVRLDHATLPTQYGAWTNAGGETGFSDTVSVAVSWSGISIIDAGSGAVSDTGGASYTPIVVGFAGAADGASYVAVNTTQSVSGTPLAAAWGNANPGAATVAANPDEGIRIDATAIRNVLDAAGATQQSSNSYPGIYSGTMPEPP